METKTIQAKNLSQRNEKQVQRRIAKKNFNIYLFLVPGILFIIIFRYLPMYGLLTAFQDYNIFSGILKSPWAGFEHFETLFSSPDFYITLPGMKRFMDRLGCGISVISVENGYTVFRFTLGQFQK